MIDVTKLEVVVGGPPPEPPTEEQWTAEIERLHWLANHPFAPEDLRSCAMLIFGVLGWSKNGKDVEPPSTFVTAHLVDYLRDEVDPSAGAHCRVCGCTDEYACPGGCEWAEPNLCSRCLENSPDSDAA